MSHYGSEGYGQRGPPPYQRGGRGPGSNNGGRRREHQGGRGPPPKKFKSSVQRPSNMRVVTNHFRVEKLNRSNVNILQYSVTISPAKYNQEINQPEKIENRRDLLASEENPSTDLTRRILNKFQQELRSSGTYILHDGSFIIYSAGPVWPHSLEEVYEMRTHPSQPNSNPQETRVRQSRPFPIKVKAECEEDAKDCEKMRSRWFIITLTFDRLVGNEQVESLCQVINTALRNVASKNPGLLCFGKSPRELYFEGDTQSRLLQAVMSARGISRDLHKEIHLGLKAASQRVETSTGPRINIIANFLLGFLKDPEEPFLKKAGNVGTIGTFNFDLRKPIPERDRTEFVDAIKGKVFDVYCKFGPGHKSGRPGTYRHKGSRIWKGEDGNFEGSVKFDTSEYKFLLRSRKEGEEEKEITVPEYYEQVYGYRLNYPALPLIAVRRNEYFPLEFLRQPFEPVGDGGSDSRKQAALLLCDTAVGKRRIAETTDLLLKTNCNDELAPFDMRVVKEALTTVATVLKSPSLHFGRDDTRDTGSGSWNLNHVEFLRPACLYSFGVLDLSGRPREVVCHAFEQLLKACSSHGIAIPNAGPGAVQECIVQARLGRDLAATLHNQVEEAIARGKSTCFSSHLYDCRMTFGYDEEGFREFRSYYDSNGNRVILDNLMYIRSADGNTQSFASYIQNMQGFSYHTVNESTMVKVNEEDPISFAEFVKNFQHYKSTSYQFVNDPDNNIMVPLDQIGYAAAVKYLPCENLTPAVQAFYECLVLRYNAKLETNLARLEDEHFKTLEMLPRLEDISILFVVLPEKKTEPYNLVKLLAGVLKGVQTQVLVTDKFCGHGGPKPQYLSNVALKINSKLATRIEDGSCWRLSEQLHENPSLAWINQAKTLVMGYSISSMAGRRDPISVVSAAACLNNNSLRCCQEMRLQDKHPTVLPGVMKGLAKDLISRFMQEQPDSNAPDRIIIYRNSGHEGNFQNIVDKEVMPFREACYELSASQNRNFQCANCAGEGTKGCSACTPPITFIIAQTDHATRAIPDEGSDNVHNVPNGTVITDQAIVGFDAPSSPASMVNGNSSRQEEGTNFLLVSNAGLKGTSKGVIYRCILNENATRLPKASCTELTLRILSELTYQMSLRYGTATKTPRLPSVLLYSSKAANIALGYTRYLTGGDFGVTYTKDTTANVDLEDRDNQGYTYNTQQENRGALYKESFRCHVSA